MLIRKIMMIGLLATPLGDLAAQEAGEVKLPEKAKFYLFLLVGQSNMAGRGTITDEDKVPHPRVLMLNKEEQWVPAVAPLHFDKPKVIGVGLGRTFGIQVAESDPSITVGLIPCAAGGSPISSWQPGGYHGQTKSHPYDETLHRTRRALADGTLKGILWHQGESDSKPELCEIYAEMLHAVIERFRRELNAPAVPFLAGQMGQFAERPWDDARRAVDAAHRDLPQQVQHTAFVSSHELTHRGDKVHFDAASYREFGRRYAKAFFELAE